MSFQWFRMWTDAIDDEKLKLLAFEDRWHFVALLCMKRKGILDAPDTAALRDRKVGAKLGLGDRDRDEVRNRLREVGLVDENWQPLGWGKRQFTSDADPTALERKHREREKRRHGRVTRDNRDSHARVTDESRPSHTAQTQISDSDTDSEKNKKPERRTACAVDEPEGFVEVRQTYPKRAGGQRWGDALKFFKRRIAEGVTVDVIVDGVRRYAEFARVTGIERTEKVQQAATFLGDNRGYLELWHPPPRQLSAVERVRAKLNGNGDERVVSEQFGTENGPSLGTVSRVLRRIPDS